MNTNQLKKFAQEARRKLLQQVEAKLEYVLSQDTSELREKATQIQKLKEELNRIGKAQLIEKVAYTWFNRLIALRFMDVNDFQPTGIRILSPKDGYTLPEILDEAKQGHFPPEIKVDEQKVLDILDGKIVARNPQNEAFSYLLIAACNTLHRQFPFLFERINDYTELLLPDDLTSEFSIIHEVVEGMSAEDCQEVEVIGWLYQFYISEKKDEVFAAKGKVKKEDIPAATQLFTPRWIVEYMVQNTLGKLWLQNRPNSRLRDHMPHFIESPSLESEDYLKVDSVEDIQLLDQACGSGHILVYAFELLTKIYEEEGYNPSEIPKLIIEKNLYGFEIDERAAQLAGLTLMMKARGYYRRLFRKEVQPNILCFEDVQFTEEELEQVLATANIEATEELKHDLQLIEQATNFGSLIQPHTPPAMLQQGIEAVEDSYSKADVFEKNLLSRLEAALRQLYLLGQKFHCVVDNPPYMGGGNMNKALSDFVKKNYKDSKSDLMACFMEAGLQALQPKGFLGMINQHSWMFLSSYEKLRKSLVKETFFDTLLHLGPRTFPEIGGEVVQNASFTFWNTVKEEKGSYIRLVDYDKSDLKKEKALEAIQNPTCGWFYTAHQKDFEKIPGSPIGYWLSEHWFETFNINKSLSKYGEGKEGLKTGNNELFLRFWFELDNFQHNKWHPVVKGGRFRRWYGNKEYVVNWNRNGDELRERGNSSVPNSKYLFKNFITWSNLTSGSFSARYIDDSLFETKSPGFFPKKDEDLIQILSFFNSKVISEFLKITSPTLDYKIGPLLDVPYVTSKIDINLGAQNIEISKTEWDSRETSWDFQQNELLRHQAQNIEESYILYCQYWKNKFHQLHRNEEEINRQFIDIYGLQDELTPDVSLEDITILREELDQKKLKEISSSYRSGWDLVDGGWRLVGSSSVPGLPFDAKEIFAQFVSYAVGCMMGRYSLDREGLVLANQGETVADYVRKVSGVWWAVDGKGEWYIDQNKNVYEHYTELQRTTNLAAEQAFGQSRLSGHESNAQRRTIRADQSDQESGREHSQQHRRGTVEGNQGVHPFSEDREGITFGTGDAIDSHHGSGDDSSQSDRTPTDRGHQHNPTDQQSDQQTKNLKTTHQSLPTAHHPPITYWPDDDAIIPILDDEWFEDDIVGRFYEFLKVSFGEKDFRKNLQFVEEQLGKDIRKYFVRDFYKDHIKRYKKRPIYWLFSSPKGAFNVLVYMHRYTPDTLSHILNNYLREFLQKLQSQKAHLEQVQISGSTAEQNKATKRIDQLDKMILDCEEYEREILYPLATERIAIDLDDGVLVNYNKMRRAVKEVKGLNDGKAKKKVRGFDWIDVGEIRG